MFFVAVAVVLVAAGATALVLAARHRRSWRTWVPLLVVVACALVGAAWLLGAPATVSY